MRISLDDRSRRGPQNPLQVNINEDYEVRYWTAALNTPKARLVAAVAKVGNCVQAVREELEAA